MTLDERIAEALPCECAPEDTCQQGYHLSHCPARHREKVRDEVEKVRDHFNKAIDFAIDEVGDMEGTIFLRCWREGDTSEWPEFDSGKPVERRPTTSRGSMP